MGRINEKLIRDMLVQIGEDPDREGLQKTPARYAETIGVLTSGYQMSPKDVFEGATFHEQYDEMVIVKDIEVFSLCEHHMLPFFGKCHIAYVPDGRIAGLSKLARLVDIFAKRLQVQERMTTQIAHAIEEQLKPKGVGVVMEAQHLCMMMRGVEKQNSVAVTSAMLGAFRSREATRMEFLNLINKSR